MHQGSMDMDTYEQIEGIIARKYNCDTTSKKAVGDFMLADTHAVNVKSNNIKKENYSPNLLSIKRMHKWVYEERNDLSFVFVDYEIVDGEIEFRRETDLIPIEHISWECLTIEAQGYGVIQKNGDLKIIDKQTKRVFYEGFLEGYKKFRMKEKKKHDAFVSRFIKNPSSITW